MRNPWEGIPLTDYENHMKLDSVMQLQAMNKMMRGQMDTYPISSIMILGIAGGNGLEHIHKAKFEKVYGVDVNSAYLKEVIYRYPELDGLLECLCINLIDEADKLPNADMVLANLLIEYIGYECFQKIVQHVNPKYVSCIIQINIEDNWVSDSPYLHIFDGLEQVHHQIEEHALKKAMLEIDYHAIKALEHMLPNGKKLVQIDFERIINMSRQIRTSAKAVIIQNGKLLAIKLNDGKEEWYILPGGGQDSEEALPQTVEREVREEAGIEVQCKDLLFVIEGVHGESFHRIDLVFLCDYLGKAKNATPHNDTNQIGYDWLDLSVLNRLPLFPSKLRRPIMNFYEGKEYTKYLGNEEIGDSECLE